jgi:hypothetical protein
VPKRPLSCPFNLTAGAEREQCALWLVWLGPDGNGTGDPSPSPAANQSLFTAGGGTAYAITDRITLDIGYCLFQIANGSSTAVISSVLGPPVGSEVVGSAFSASELFFAFRIYEPFRNWRQELPLSAPSARFV